MWLLIIIVFIILFLMFELYFCQESFTPELKLIEKKEDLDNNVKEDNPIVITENEKNDIQNIMNELNHPQREFTTATSGDELMADRNLIMGSRARDAIFANARKSTQTYEAIVRPELDYLENVDWWERDTEHDFDDYKN